MSRFRRLVVSDRFFFVTCRLLPRRGKLQGSELERLARVVQARREKYPFLLAAWVFLPDPAAAGNLTKDSSNLTAHTYQWDAEGRVTSVDPGNNPPTWTFTYNALGERVQWVSPAGTDQHLFDPSGTWLGNAGEYSIVWWGDAALALYLSGNTQFNHINNLGSTALRTNQAGTAVEDMLFYPWGDVWQSWGSGGYNFAEMPYYDTSTNTGITMFRHFSPSLGRWHSPDLLAGDVTNPQSLNRYAYVMNNPTSMVDPLGLGGPPSLPPKVVGGACEDPLVCAFSGWDEFDLLEIAFAPTALLFYSVVNSEGGLQWDPDDPNFANEFGGMLYYGNLDAADLAFLLAGQNPGPLGPGPGPVAPYSVRRCAGPTRVLAGNPATIGSGGAVPGVNVAAGSAAAIFSQFGLPTSPLGAANGMMAQYGFQIFGVVAVPSLQGLVGFGGITDQVGGKSPIPGMGVRDALQYLNPTSLILELPSLPKDNDPGTTFGIISVPGDLGCPAGTSPI